MQFLYGTFHSCHIKASIYFSQILGYMYFVIFLSAECFSVFWCATGCQHFSHEKITDCILKCVFIIKWLIFMILDITSALAAYWRQMRKEQWHCAVCGTTCWNTDQMFWWMLGNAQSSSAFSNNLLLCSMTVYVTILNCCMWKWHCIHSNIVSVIGWVFSMSYKNICYLFKKNRNGLK